MFQIERSLETHQKLIELIHNNYDKTGICRLSQKEMGVCLGKSQSWIAQAIKRINAEKVCIERVSGGYIVNFTDLKQEGTFVKILELLSLFLDNPNFLEINEKQLAEMLSIKRRTIQAAKAYYNDFYYQYSKQVPQQPTHQG